jgi:hypothetical protein
LVIKEAHQTFCIDETISTLAHRKIQAWRAMSMMLSLIQNIS